MAVVFGIAVVHLLVYSFVPINIELKQANGSSFHKNCSIGNYKHLLNILLLVEANLIPFCTMMMTTVVIVIKLNKSRKTLKRSQRWQKSNQERRKQKDLRFAFNSIVLNLLDIILEVPILVSYLINIQNPLVHKLFQMTSLFLYCFSYSVSFLVHFLSNRLFRSEFLLMLGVEKPQQFDLRTAVEFNVGPTPEH
jgi:hypothetical protein